MKAIHLRNKCRLRSSSKLSTSDIAGVFAGIVYREEHRNETSIDWTSNYTGYSPRVILAPLQFGLTLEMHHRFSSRFIVDALSGGLHRGAKGQSPPELPKSGGIVPPSNFHISMSCTPLHTHTSLDYLLKNYS